MKMRNENPTSDDLNRKINFSTSFRNSQKSSKFNGKIRLLKDIFDSFHIKNPIPIYTAHVNKQMALRDRQEISLLRHLFYLPRQTHTHEHIHTQISIQTSLHFIVTSCCHDFYYLIRFICFRVRCLKESV